MKWIHIDEEKPKPNTKLLVCRIGKKTSTEVMFMIYKNREINPWEYLDGDTCNIKITHWMYCPEVPQFMEDNE